MKYLKYILSFYFLHSCINLQGQNILGVNLVQNPSFEDYYQCPYSSGQLNFAKYWWGINTEYYNVCSVNNSLSCPLNYNGFQYPNYGDAYAGFVLYTNLYLNNPNYKEAIKTKLKDSLIANKRYCTNLYISLSDSSFSNTMYIQLDTLGMLFTKNQVQDIISPICSNCSQINNNISTLDSANWLKLSGYFIANGGEKYLSIGNFQNTIHWPSGKIGYIYIYIDDVSVCECSFDINLGADTMLCESETIILNPNLPNATYTWQDSSHTATYEVKQPGTYWVRAYVAEYDVYSSDTIVITQGDDNFCNPPLTIPNVITPNGDGANDNFVIQNAESYTIILQIYNRWGRLVYETTNYQNDFSCKTCAAGVYYYVIKAKSKRNGREKEYKGSLTIVSE